MDQETPIAVIGLSYRAPGIGRSGLWEYLEQARSAWTKFPERRFDHSAYWNPGDDRSGVFRAEGAHFLAEDIFAFDAGFFRMRAEEARTSDPQHRLMLECAFEAAEDAGKSLLDLAGGRVGVYIGSGQHEYSQRLGDDHHAPNTFSATGVAPCMVANRLSYFFDIDGPSVALDAACASSVYAAHQAVSALNNKECDAAFVGAAALSLGPGGWLALEKTGALSQHGRSYSYDEKASGFGRGEGAACLLIKRLDDALRDGDPIQAVIRSSACNHGGRCPEGITMPNGVAHRKLLHTVHDRAGLDPCMTSVVEGHGTGTAAGDPIEAGAFASVLGKDRTSANPIYIGSVKSNFGHLEGASGVLGMVKAILMVKRGVILPTAGFEKINPRIPDKDKLVVPTAPIQWPANEHRRVLVTNFGFGGSNSAIVLEEAAPWLPKKAPVVANGHHHTNGANGTNGDNNHGDTPAKSKVFVFSARSEKSLTSYLENFDEYLDDVADESAESLNNLSYTLGQRRTHHPYRFAAVAASLSDLQQQLLTAKIVRAREQVIVYVFTGQGAQYARMAYGLNHFKEFATAIDKAEEQVNAMGATWSLKEELAKTDSESRIHEAEISQPVCTAVQIALVMLLNSWAVRPTLVTGHSSGEIAAAFAAGFINLETAMAISYFRGQAAAKISSEQKKKGAMLALGTGMSEALILIEQHANSSYATVAAINSLTSVTISGDQLAIESIHQAAESRGIFARRLKVQMAYHSRHMEGVADFYLNAIKPYCQVNANAASNLPQDAGRAIFVSSVTGSQQRLDEIDASYWVKNLVRPVRFADAMRSILSYQGKGTAHPALMSIIEIGPHAALKGYIQQSADAARNASEKSPSFAYKSSLQRGQDGMTLLKKLAGDLFETGATVLLGEVNQSNMHNSEVVTGLPPYAWDKSVSYEVRPRATHHKLYPGEAFHPLLGRRVVTDGGEQRIYRQVFSLDEMPWIRDHVVAGAIIFPMTGYMSCAIEAARRTTPHQVSSILIQDFHVVSRLEILEDESVDMVTRIWPLQLGTNSFSSATWSFEISSWRDVTGWTVHAYGRVEPEMEKMACTTPTLKASLPLIKSTSGLIEHDATSAYQYAGVRATQYGPTFRNTVRFFEGKGYTLLEHHLRDIGDAREASNRYGSPISIDPPTLDGFLQGGGPLQITEDGRRPAQMPNYVSRFRVSNHMPTDPKHRFDIVSRLVDYDFKGGRMQISVAAFARGPDGSVEPVAEWETIAFRSIGSADDDDDPVSNLPDNWTWEMLPRIDLLEPDEIAKHFPAEQLSNAHVSNMKRLNEAALYYIHRALEETAADDRGNLPVHLTRFVHWASRVLDKREHSFKSEPTELLAQVKAQDGQGEMLCAVGEELVPILRQQREPLELMLANGLLTKHYESDILNRNFSAKLGDVVLALSNLETNLRILEVGAGTAGTTLPVLEALSRHVPQGALLEYTFTDISSGFFENARLKLGRWSHCIKYKKLDISQDPMAQGFDADKFDLVIAANVLHATKDMETTMKNLRHLLVPGGKVMVLEAWRHQVSAFPFALLPGWWYAEDKYRDPEEGPFMSVETWNSLLVNTGFAGVEANIQGRVPGFDTEMNLMCSTKESRQDETPIITICGQFTDDEDMEFAHAIADAAIERFNYAIETKPFTEIKPSNNSYYIFVDSPTTPLLHNVSVDRFERLQRLLVNNAGLLWVILDGEVPEAKIIKGMLRTLRLETDRKNLLCTDKVPQTAHGASAVAKLIKTLCAIEGHLGRDQDFVWHEGSFKLPRMRCVKDSKEVFAAEQGILLRQDKSLWQGQRALEMTLDVAGNADSIYFRRTQHVQSPLAEDDILVQIEAAGICSRDLDIVQGAVPWSPPGFDGAGKVVRVGSRVTDLQEGDRVCFLALDGSAFASYKRMPAWHAARIPGRMSTTEAASVPLAYSLAVLALVHNGKLKKGESVLIHAATGAVGQACLRVAQYLGARVYATAGSEDKKEFLHQTLGLSRDQIFSSRCSKFRDDLLCATGGKGLDVIVNSGLTGELLTDTWALVAPFGRFIELDKKASLQNNYLPMRSFNRNVSFSSVDLRGLFQYRPEQVREVLADIIALLRTQIIQPIQPITVVPVSQFSSGLRKLRSGENQGKVVASLGPDQHVMAQSDLEPAAFSLRQDATYLITGGTRGIGLNLAQWMIDNGARNIVVLGRSGASGTQVQQLLQKYEDTDIRVRALACDISCRDHLVKVLDQIRDLPPIYGVLHSALLLSDKLFENATFEDWETIMGPRVQGAWNLHQLLPSNLDFFIALGSFLGDTGNGGQAIYAGSATFYEAFARHRNALGQHTVSIALPVVVDVGYVADRDLKSMLERRIGASVTMADIRTIVKGIIIKSPIFCQDGRASIFKLSVDGKPVIRRPWHYFHPIHSPERSMGDDEGDENRHGPGDNAALLWTAAFDPLQGLTDAMITKVAAMAIMDRDEVHADVPVASYDLDSLVSVELRNWIKRETGVELLLSAITHAASLRELAADILVQREQKLQGGEMI